jgi:hypothetical protein
MSELNWKPGEYDLAVREIVLKENEQRISRWLFPILLGLGGVILTGCLNVFATFYNGYLQRQLEENKEESDRILEVIKTFDQSKVRLQFQFLLDAGLISQKRETIAHYIATTNPENFPGLPKYKPAPTYDPLRISVQCELRVSNNTSMDYKRDIARDALRTTKVIINKGFHYEGFAAVATATPSGMKDSEDITVTDPFIVTINGADDSPTVIFGIPDDENKSAILAALGPIVRDTRCLTPK